MRSQLATHRHMGLFLEKSNTFEFKEKCEREKEVGASIKSGSLHTGGSMSFAAYK